MIANFAFCYIISLVSQREEYGHRLFLQIKNILSGDPCRMTKQNVINDAIEYIPLKTKEGNPVKKPLYEVASSHRARRTFIGNIYKKVKDPNLIGALSGHK